ncbi:methyltransferase domain-containing protein [Maribellus comscasis]|uniref:Methyltransferase domain-containing protein n=1 Tax=Maribellus comscasis TaxID=2681766 RepID=A0A6I6JP40_9BACT|nr:class I SAM-dependent methyltransferase [Maribellus comscasis]QGY44221.1 methyltransferase domain-containing protein [Maribellus comscasis]
MQKRHTNRIKYFEEQGITTAKHVIPYLSDLIKIEPKTEVLEIGCGEAGNLKPFIDIGCKATGIDISHGKIKQAEKFYSNHKNRNNLELICEDIYKHNSLDKKYDLIMMRDVIEHILNQEKFMGFIKQFLKPDGKIFLAFPPWQNPFGGHQQICGSKLLSKIPFFHLLPQKTYRFILKSFGENESQINTLVEIKQTGISIERFERIIKQEKFSIDKRTYYFINPNYETKFGLKPRTQSKLISSIPWLRNFFTTAMYYVISQSTLQD